MTGLRPTVSTADGPVHIGTRILVGDDRQLVWTSQDAQVQVSVHRIDGTFEYVLATAQRGFSYEAALAAYALTRKDAS